MLLNEDKIRNIVRESILSVLNESRGLKSKKLYDIVKAHGGFSRHGSHRVDDVHNMTDDDIICVMTRNELEDAWRTRTGLGRYWEERGLYAWAKERGVNLEKGDDVDAIELKDYNYVIVVVRNMHQVKGREGQGWDAWDKKKEKRRHDALTDGADRYIPQYYDPERSQIWKNPYRKDKRYWSDQDVKDTMQRIRDRRKNGGRRKLY